MMSSATGLVAGAGMSPRRARRLTGCLIVGQVAGIMAIVLASMRAFDTSFEQTMAGLSLAANLMAGPAAPISLAVGWVSIELGIRIRSLLQRRARG